MTLTELGKLALEFVQAEEAFLSAVEANARSQTHSLERVRPLEIEATQRYEVLRSAAMIYAKRKRK